MSKTTVSRVLCQFPLSIAPNNFYTCYQKEKCCDEGCCLVTPYQLHQIWYYWGIFVLICGVVSASKWLCRKTERRAEATVSAESLPGYVHYCNEEISMDQLMLTLANCGSGDPPSYNSVVPTAPPAYHDVYKKEPNVVVASTRV